MTYLFTAVLAWAVSVTVTSVLLWRAQQRCYQYAVRMFWKLDANDRYDRAASAYSDMATVITLDGKCDDKEWAGAK